MRIRIMLISLTLLLLIWNPAAAIGMSSSSGGCVARNALEAYCINHGGCPKDGNCYFPDGGYCDLKSFYQGTCPGREYYEDALWMMEAYAFLYGNYVPYGQYYVPGVGYPYYANLYGYQIPDSQVKPEPGSPYYPYFLPVYSPEYGSGYGKAYGTGSGIGSAK